MIWLAVIVLPLLLAFLLLRLESSQRISGPLFFVATLPALIVALGDFEGIRIDWLLLETHFDLDTPRRILLILTSILWATASLFAGFYIKERQREFAVYFGGAMAGNFGLLIAADVPGFYTFFALMTFASYGLVVHSRTKAARRAGRIYLVMAIFGELFLITALYLAVNRADSFLLADLGPAIAEDPYGVWIFLIGLIGFGVKVGAIPLYFWLPLAHPVAPTPASAVLSGAMIKAGLVGWMHLAPVGLVEWPAIALLMMVLGFTAALGAVLVGLAQVDPKTNLAYSSISQMGLMTALLGMGMSGNIPPELLLPALALYAFNHGTAKALLFLGTALPGAVGGIWRIVMWAGLVIGVLAIAGAPLTGGLWTKYFLKTFLGEVALPGSALMLQLLTISAIATTLLLGRFLFLLGRIKAPETKNPPPYLFPWIILIFAGGWWTLNSVLLPFELADHVTKGNSLAHFFFSFGTIWDSFWPVALGAALLIATQKWKVLNRWPTAEPIIPPGDFLVFLLNSWGSFIRMGKKLRPQSWFLHFEHPDRKLYGIVRGSRTKKFSLGAEDLLRRWEVVGICFILLFMILFLILR